MDSEEAFYRINTPIGVLGITGDSHSIHRIFFDPERTGNHPNSLLLTCAGQLEAYFAGKLQRFDLPLHLEGTAFQQQVWKIVSEIPYGKTFTYAEIASILQNPGSVRAVGQTNGMNPLPVIIPCHRVIGKNGSLTGYAGGTWRKKWLLQHEYSLIPPPLFSANPAF